MIRSPVMALSSLLLLFSAAAIVSANQVPWVCEQHAFHVWTNFSKPGPGPRHSAFPDPGIHVRPSGKEAVGDELVRTNWDFACCVRPS